MVSQIDDFLNQKMDRKEFLKNIGAGLAAVVGMGMIVRAFQSQSPQKQANNSGYGGSTYGGSPKVASANFLSRKV